MPLFLSEQLCVVAPPPDLDWQDRVGTLRSQRKQIDEERTVPFGKVKWRKKRLEGERGTCRGSEGAEVSGLFEESRR